MRAKDAPMLALLEKIRAEEAAWLEPLLAALHANELYRLALLLAAIDPKR
jgi:hypothetical protein